VATPEAIVAGDSIAGAAEKPSVLILGPALSAMSGVSTHLRMLLGSRLTESFALHHFQVGSEGRREGVAARLARIVSSPFALAAALRARRAALVHLNTSMNSALWRDLVYALVARACGARVLCQVHGGKLPQQVFPRSGLARRLLCRALAFPDALAVLARTELDAYRNFVPGQTVVVAANAVVCAPTAPPRSQPGAVLDRPLRLVFVGRLTREKGLRELLRALATARGRGTAAILTVAGTGADEPRLRLLATQLGLSGAVVFAGPVFGKDKMRLLRAADVFVLPSYSEGLPYALLEAMSFGVPVIATPVGAIRDVVVDGVHGLLVAPREARAVVAAIEQLAADRHQLAKMGAACRARIASAYSIEHLVHKFAGLYSALCADGHRRSSSGANRRIV
jgi:glycosyltransferase involved in cell wall biosynthesis